MDRILRRIGISLFALAFSTSLLAQTFRGGITGTVTDKSGAAIPGAAVYATDVNTNVVYRGVASSAGEFSFSNLPLGTYTLLISSPGFSAAKYEQVNVSAGAPYVVAAKLVVSSATQTVEVTANALALDTTTDLQATVLPETIVQNLPNSGRDFTQMLSQTTGFAGLSTGGGAGAASVNGTRTNAINWQIEGTDNNDLWWNIPAVNQGGVSAIAGVVFPIDAIENFSFVTTGSTALGRNPGGTANLTVKSGTNSLHGTAYYSNHNEFFEATNPFLVSKQLRKTASRLQDYGFSVGGPIWKDHAFFFLSGEHQNFLIGAENSNTEPTTQYQTDALALLAYYGVPQNAVTTNLVNGTATTPGLWPAAVIKNCVSTAATPCNAPNNYTATGNLTGHSFNGVAKLSGKLSEKDTLAAVWFVGQGTQTAPTSSDLTPYFENAPIHVQNYSVVYNRLVSSSIANQISAGVSYFNQVFSDFNTNYNLSALGLNTGVTDPALAGSPNIIIGAASTGSGLTANNSGFDHIGPTAPSGRQDITGHIDDDLTWTKGKHQMHFGGEFRKAQVYDFYQTGQRGKITFDGTEGPWTPSNFVAGVAQTPCAALATKNQGAAPPPQFSSNDIGLADFLAGCLNPGNSSIVLGNPKRKVFVNTWDIYGQDAWQLTSRLSFNYGVRYDYEGPVHSQDADLSVFDPNTPSGLAVAGATTGPSVPNIYNKFYGGVSPRVGFAYQLGNSGKTVLRGGYGFYYDSLYMKAILQNNGVQNISVFGPGLNPAGVHEVVNAQGNNAVIKSGVDIYPTFAQASGVAATPGSISVSTFDPNLKPANVQLFDLNLQHSFGNAVVAQIGYVGSKGTHLLGIFDINPIATAATPGVTPATLGTRPYATQFPLFGVIDEERSNLGSIYHSLQASIKTQSFHGLTAGGGYTWSHALDYETGLLPYLPQNPNNERGEYGNSDFDVRNTFTGYFDYVVPGFRGPRRLTHGFEVNSGMSFHQGTPYTVYASSNVSGNGDSADRAVQVLAHPNAVNHSIVGGAVNWYNGAAFVDPAPGTYSPTRRGQNYNPGYNAVDISLIKTTPITERIGTQFKINMYNALNRTNLAPLGLPGVTNSNLNPAGAAPTPGSNGTIGSTVGPFLGNPTIGPGEPFNAEFAFKILF